MDVRKALAEKILLFDGAMGTMLQAAGLPAGGLPEIYNLTHPEIVLGIHKDYVAAGCDVVTSNTFQAGELKLAGSGYTPEEVIAAGVRLAKESGAKYTALDIGPLGQLMKPMGTLSFEDAYAMFRRQIEAGAAAGADLILFETMSDLLEVKAGVLAAKECCDLPVFVTMTYQQDGRTFVGCSPECAALTLSGLGVNALGVNCSLGPEELMPVVETLLEWSRVPVMVQPNAGLPKMKDGKTVYDISTEEFANLTSAFAAKGAAVLGGCCGTTPAFLSALRKKIDGMDRVLPKQKPITAVCSGTRTAVLDGGVSVIGERINPTGKKRLKEKLREQDFDYIAGEAISQKQHGADILDVNCGLPEIDEAAVLCRAVEEVQAVTDLPLQIDSSDPEAIAQAVRRYNGKPIINSVSGKAESLQTILPIAAKYGAMVVGLTLDETGIPETAEKRYEIAQRIVREAEKYGVPRQDILIDCLVLTASAQQELVMETLRAIQLVKAGLGVKTVLGVSNVSFGLPSRPVLNSVFLAAGFGAGLDAAIVNPLSEEIMQTVRAFRVLNAQDKDAAAYIANASVEEKPVVKAETRTLSDSIMEGRAEETAAGTRKLLETTAPMEIIDQWFIPALDKVGEQYEQGQLFLPQLIRAAEAVKSGFEVLRAAMPEGGADKGTIVVATVEGDIHDIGKNIAKMLLQNYGYRVIDLGKDVPVEKVVQAAMESGAPLIGLSALMTTTVTSMRDTITALRKAGCTAKIMAGGAVLNEEYIQYVGADYYARDARIGVQIAAQVFGGQQ
ncbi:homocysteine S-methyltransferase family protein [Ructibacterium gallinarum]|uniref:Methionine synthase n=1 Tax=Ructibacterium gallinarum TaxID=2779355 RepID=A0A9D5R951_9FIRM|nr:homocysteine S-methyltransferase family protein [Ructibacterium gallinarum]MBE5040662.1 homocysteine S-methyltransferase family protein [Ructibacterium gallinarum]